MNFEELKSKAKERWSRVNFSEWSLDFLAKKNRIFLLVFSLMVLGYGAYLWYSYIYHPGWSAKRRQEYLQSRKEEDVVFNRKRFEKVLLETENRKNNFQKPVENIPDIFSLE